MAWRRPAKARVVATVELVNVLPCAALLPLSLKGGIFSLTSRRLVPQSSEGSERMNHATTRVRALSVLNRVARPKKLGAGIPVMDSTTNEAI